MRVPKCWQRRVRHATRSPYALARRALVAAKHRFLLDTDFRSSLAELSSALLVPILNRNLGN